MLPSPSVYAAAALMMPCFSDIVDTLSLYLYAGARKPAPAPCRRACMYIYTRRWYGHGAALANKHPRAARITTHLSIPSHRHDELECISHSLLVHTLSYAVSLLTIRYAVPTYAPGLPETARQRAHSPPRMSKTKSIQLCSPECGITQWRAQSQHTADTSTMRP